MRLAFITSLLLCSNSLAEVVIAPDKASALRNCQEKAEASPQSLREEMLSWCQCVVEHTDFQRVEQLHQEKKSQELQQLHLEANNACKTK